MRASANHQQIHLATEPYDSSFFFFFFFSFSWCVWSDERKGSPVESTENGTLSNIDGWRYTANDDGRRPRIFSICQSLTYMLDDPFRGPIIINNRTTLLHTIQQPLAYFSLLNRHPGYPALARLSFNIYSICSFFPVNVTLVFENHTIIHR